MNERTKQFRVGLVVFFILLVSSILVVLNSDFSALPFHDVYKVNLLVDEAPGVSPGTPVRRRGLPIGRVASVEDTDDGALITMDIQDGKHIKSNELGRIQTSLVGDAVIEFMQVSSPIGAATVAPDATVKGKYVSNPMDMMADMQGDLKLTIMSLGDAGKEVAELADRVNQVLGENDMQRVKQLVESTDRAMVQFTQVTTNINDVIGDPLFKQQLKDGLSQLPSLVGDARAIMGALQGALRSADENLKNLQGLTGPLGDRGTAIVATLEQSVRNLEELLGQVAQLTRNVNNSEGTVGLLIRDRAIYDNLNQTIAQANAAVGDVRKIVGNPELSRRIDQILYNVWVLTDKLARDPARLARGIVNRETPIK
jgi:phospholipid/cholesterol/gamma-HCH transport system substrate-binding protein